MDNLGTGKTHLAIAIAYNEGTIDRKIKLFYKYKLVVIDEGGCNEILPLESKIFFQLIDTRYTKQSTIFTSNISFDKWSQILSNDKMITKAILDRILHYSYLFNITELSYRIKDKLNIRKTENS